MLARVTSNFARMDAISDWRGPRSEYLSAACSIMVDDENREGREIWRDALKYNHVSLRRRGRMKVMEADLVVVPIVG